MLSPLRLCCSRVFNSNKLFKSIAIVHIDVRCYAKPPATKKLETIFLYDDKGKVLGTKTKMEAETLARKQGFILTPFQAPSHHKFSAYKLSEKAEKDDNHEAGHPTNILEGELPIKIRNKVADKKPAFKIEDRKKVAVTIHISDHDIEIKSGQIKKWCERMCDVQVNIKGGHGQANLLESVFQKFNQHLAEDFRILQKVVKAGDVKFTVSPDPKKIELYNQRIAEGKKHGDQTKPEEFAANPSDLDDDELQTMINERLKKK